MSTSNPPDSQFQIFIKDFASAFGIPDPEQIHTNKREILASSVRLDTVIPFGEEFDFTTLKDKIFPFLAPLSAIEYKALNDLLKVGHVYQYGLTELGLLAMRYLSQERKDRKERKERQWLSQEALTAQWEQYKRQGALHSCCMIILSTSDPRGPRREEAFEPVEEYPHLAGALYKWVISENRFVGSFVTYLVVLNKLPVCALNAPLLLLTTGRKKRDFCHWLLEDAEGLTLEEKQDYQHYLIDNDLIKNEEVEKAMRHQLFGPPRYDWIFEGVAEKPKEYQEGFYQTALDKMVETASPQEVAQKALEATSPVDAVLKLIQTPEERQKLLEYLTQQG